ncbi:calcium-binding protein [Stenotrophomonas maltophilia]|uniref:Calcium-binding protein n=1 Tax=Stenotrophomonas maltophilia TaxID=40324 RepID=A0A1A6XMI1_STEMA|nr:calcium-binding protein [Stenotrophomonas maltophilia]OBU63910.1 calcium-binding protein [Stenotrophomonas maltophilia]
MHSIFRWTAALLLALGMALSAHADDTAAQIRQHAGDHRLIVLGELHGTREVPVLVREMMEAYAADGAPVRLALELPTGENEALATYLASAGTAKARAALRGTTYWNVRSRMHDGRRSEDMLDLIEAARVLRTRGRDVQVFGFDRVLPAETAGSGARDRVMAEEVRARAQALPNNGRLLVLTGNVHGMRTQPKMIAYPPMTSLLKDLDVYNVRIEARGGEGWGCTAVEHCGARPLRGHAGASPRVDTDADRSYDLWVWLPRFSVARLLDRDSVW